MQRIWSIQLSEHVGERVRLAGWLHRFRRLGNIAFLIVRDGQGTGQVVVDDPGLIERVGRLPNESVLAIEGKVVAEPQAPGGVEVRGATVEVVTETPDAPPFDLFRPTLHAQLPTQLDHAALSLRHPKRRALIRMTAAAMEGFRNALRSLRFVEIQTPKIVDTATESGANVFRVDYFGRTAYLAQSPQLYKQIMVGVFERVFEVGPVFRAEPHDTTRHLNEYVSLDAELGFIVDHTTVMEVLTEALRGMERAIGEEERDGTTALGLQIPLVPARIPCIDFADAQVMLARATGEPIVGEPDLAPGHEAWLGAWAQRVHGSDFLFVTGYPMAKRPFYTHPDPDMPASSQSFDLLLRGVEIATGGRRLHQYDDYLAALSRLGIDPAPLGGYLEAFRHGMPPHGGFAIGLERYVARLAGLANVREATLFPRDLHRLTP